jgi:hypothetical protein
MFDKSFDWMYVMVLGSEVDAVPRKCYWADDSTAGRSRTVGCLGEGIKVEEIAGN